MARFELATTRFTGEVTLIFTTGQTYFLELPTEQTPGNLRKEFETELLRNLVHRGNAPIPQVRSLGRSAILLGQFEAK